MERSWRLIVAAVLLSGLGVLSQRYPTQAGGAVGDGTAGSCTEAALDDVLVSGGLVSFNCHPSDLPIVVTSEKTIEVNTRIDGGGLITLSGGDTTGIFIVNPDSMLELDNITLADGQAGSSYGGAIHNEGGTVTLTNSTLRDNAADTGGGIFNDGGTVTLTNSTLSGNTVFGGGTGGGIHNFGTLTLINSTVSDNTAELGGGIYNIIGTVTLTNSIVSNNTASIAGGIYSFDASFTLLNSIVSENRALADNGGGIFSDRGSFTLTNSTLSGNGAVGKGGGIYNYASSATLTNSTLSGNLSVGGGGGIHSFFASVMLTNSTLSGNTAHLGGGIENVTSAVALRNTIIANSPGGNCVADAVTSLGGNLSDDTTCALDQPSDLDNTDAGLGPLADNGGPTPTHLPQAGSNAIDGGLLVGCPAIDQRGVSRPQGNGCDIGAVEVGRTATYPLCASYYTGAVTSPLSGDCGAGTVELAVQSNLSFCLNPWTGQVLYTFGRACNPPRLTHTMPDDGDLLTCVSYYTGANRWVQNHSQCTAYEVANTIPAMP